MIEGVGKEGAEASMEILAEAYFKAMKERLELQVSVNQTGYANPNGSTTIMITVALMDKKNMHDNIAKCITVASTHISIKPDPWGKPMLVAGTGY